LSRKLEKSKSKDAIITFGKFSGVTISEDSVQFSILYFSEIRKIPISTKVWKTPKIFQNK
jgi:hypothetical protein